MHYKVPGELLLVRDPQAQRERPVVGGVVVAGDAVVGVESFGHDCIHALGGSWEASLAQIITNESLREIEAEPHTDHTQDESRHKPHVRPEPPPHPSP